MSKERRDFPRIETEHSVELMESDGGVFPTLALDISLTGMQLLCDRPTAERIVPDGLDADPREFDVRLRITLGDGESRRLKIRCQVMSVREVEHDEFRIGLKFVRFDGDSYHALEAYIDESLPD